VYKGETEAEEWNTKGKHFAKLGEYKKSIQCFDKAISIDPNHALAWYNKGLVLKISGKHAESTKCLDKAVDIDAVAVATESIMKDLGPSIKTSQEDIDLLNERRRMRRLDL
jgi:tetratricopeptide (TPR) repeat protein